jgi:uncharacterized protein (TIGR03437 family)
MLGDGKHIAGQIFTPNGYDLVGPANTFSFTTRPAKVGETLVLYGVGFGATYPPVLAGQPVSGYANAVSTIRVSIGGFAAYVAFAGITEAGLFQFNVVVPNVASGDQPIQAQFDQVETADGPVVTIQ